MQGFHEKRANEDRGVRGEVGGVRSEREGERQCEMYE